MRCHDRLPRKSKATSFKILYLNNDRQNARYTGSL